MVVYSQTFDISTHSTIVKDCQPGYGYTIDNSQLVCKTPDSLINDKNKSNITIPSSGTINNPRLYSQSCIDNEVQQWDKIVFKITNADLAESVGLPANTELDIKVLDDPSKVVNLEQRVIDFLDSSDLSFDSKYIEIIDVEHATICGLTDIVTKIKIPPTTPTDTTPTTPTDTTPTTPTDTTPTTPTDTTPTTPTDTTPTTPTDTTPT
ncbi:MAG: hypothetical protein AB7U98_12335, partial [Candidatus Nitrosocosmicus sp.]